jgi:hypothetical protein
MADPQANSDEDSTLARRVSLTEPGRDGGLSEFFHVLATILARIDNEQRHRVQSGASPEPDEDRKEEP